MDMTEKNVLERNEVFLLLWLAQEDFSQYGECYGAALDRLFALGLAVLHGPGEHQNFIASDHAGTKGIMFQAVSLTDAGLKLAREIRDSRADQVTKDE